MTHTTTWTTLKPSSGWQLIDWRELLRYKDLLYFLTVRGIRISVVD